MMRRGKMQFRPGILGRRHGVFLRQPGRVEECVFVPFSENHLGLFVDSFKEINGILETQ